METTYRSRLERTVEEIEEGDHWRDPSTNSWAWEAQEDAKVLDSEVRVPVRYRDGGNGVRSYAPGTVIVVWRQ